MSPSRVRFVRMLPLAALALVATLAGPPPAAASLLDNNAQLSFQIVEYEGVGGGMYAIARVTSFYGVPLEGTLTIVANGRTLKVEPVETSSTQEVRVRAGDNWQAISACATFIGATHVSSDNFIWHQLQLCRSMQPSYNRLIVRPPAVIPTIDKVRSLPGGR
jgi:hypothetical protein